VAGDVQAAFVSTALAVPQVKGGKLRALGTTAAARSALLPDVPTFAEAGWPKLDFSAWFALFLPAGTPAAAIEQLGRQALAAVQAPEVRQKLQEAGFSVTGLPRADTERVVKAESQRWAAVVKASGFKAD
jgi:tripartite-type tricarboxylate transporter receptor subunit TctC